MKQNKGFTLIEIVLALSLMGLVLTAIAGICLPLKNSIKAAKERQHSQSTLLTMLNRLNSDLQFAWNPESVKENHFVGHSHDIQFYSLDSLKFTGKPFIPGTRKVFYRYQNEGARLQWGEKPLAGLNDNPEFYTLAGNLMDFRFRFLGKSGWTPVWDKPDWPKGISVSGIYSTQRGEEISFEHFFYPQAS